MCVVPKRHQILDRILATAAARGEVDVVLGARDALARCPHHLAAAKGDKAAVATILDAKTKGAGARALHEALLRERPGWRRVLQSGERVSGGS